MKTIIYFQHWESNNDRKYYDLMSLPGTHQECCLSSLTIGRRKTLYLMRHPRLNCHDGK